MTSKKKKFKGVWLLMDGLLKKKKKKIIDGRTFFFFG